VTIAIWNSRYETGIKIIDAQHQDLFAAVNQLADSFQEGRAQDQTGPSLDFLIRYTTEHFQTEEQHMREIGFPYWMEHAEEHTRLLEKAEALQADHDSGKVVTMELVIFFADWLKHHINEVDLQYVEFLKEQGRED